MLAALHHNFNIDAELSGQRVVLRQTERISRANRAPSTRIHKTIINKWQLEIMNSLENIVDENDAVVEEAVDELANISIDDLDNNLDENFDGHWAGFFNDHVYI